MKKYLVLPNIFFIFVLRNLKTKEYEGR
jgi:hypothetical protein